MSKSIRNAEYVEYVAIVLNANPHACLSVGGSLRSCVFDCVPGHIDEPEDEAEVDGLRLIATPKRSHTDE